MFNETDFALGLTSNVMCNKENLTWTWDEIWCAINWIRPELEMSISVQRT